VAQFGSERHGQELAPQFTLPARQHRSVQNLIWVGENILLSFHVRTVVVWTFGVADDLESATVTDNGYTARTLETGTKGMSMCGAFDSSRDRFVVGDTRGNLSCFDFRGEIDSEGVLQPVSRALCVHKKEHVNDVGWSASDKIFSVRNDGRMVESIVDQDGHLRTTLSVPVGNFSGLAHI